MSKYISQLEIYFSEFTDKENAFNMKKYMREKFEFLGIKSNARRKLASNFYKENGNFLIENIERDANNIWKLNEREFQYIYLDFLKKNKSKLTINDLDTIEYLIKNKSWWDTIDMIAQHLIGEIFKTNELIIKYYKVKWQESEDIWLKRTLILFQLKYKEKTDKKELFEIINRNLNTGEFFIDKAIGWALREYSKTNSKAVKEFIEKTDLSKLSVKEGSKYL